MRLRHYLREFDQVAGRVREKGKLAADGFELERLGHDLDTAGSKVGDGLLDIRHVDAEMVIAGIAETIAESEYPGASIGRGLPPPNSSTRKPSSFGGAM